MPTVVKGAPVASRIPPHENRAKPRVVPDENQAESLRRVVPDENRAKPRVAPYENQAELLRRVAHDKNQAKSLCTSLLMRIAAASPRCSARYENRGTPRPIRKTIPPSGLTGKNDTPETIPTDFPRKCHRRGQTNNLPRGRSARKADRRKQTAKITQKTEVYIFILPHQSRKSNGTEWKYAICLYSRPSRKAKYCCLATYIAFIAFTTKNFTPK